MSSVSAEYLIGLTLTALGGICGSAWWMSALYTNVKSIRWSMENLIKDLKEFVEQQRNENRSLHDKLTDHEMRITRLEERRSR